MNLQRPVKRKKRNLQWRTDVLVVGGELSAQGGGERSDRCKKTQAPGACVDTTVVVGSVKR